MATVTDEPHQPARLQARTDIPGPRRAVVKIGSSSLTRDDGHLDETGLRIIADRIAGLLEDGWDVVIISSGAIAASLRPLNLGARPTDVPSQQAAASVGQALLATAWSAAFGAHGRITGQVLLTEADVIRRETYGSVRTALEAMLGLGIIPIINENDTTATHEIRFGDNDRLAALVSQLLGADLLVLLTDVDGLYTKNPAEPDAERLSVVEDFAALTDVKVGSVGSSVGTGGMVTKLDAAHHAASTGTATLLTAAENFGRGVSGEDVGTFFPAQQGRRRSRLVWLRYATRGAGTLVVDKGAADALRSRRRSLLAVGIAEVDGAFPAGVPVDIAAPDGEVIARGLVAYSSEDLRAMAGLTTKELRARMGDRYGRSVVHRDDMVLITSPVAEATGSAE
ncbi:glutamate 5-kinase [Brachybacterium subflavum]|uniref:glutamate 5-kinase n=1 Tax=Brachybacterium subflavum TaxID=2585206 RepID=UPI001266710E|nr:glutamate 5-kinase [Brachybacterium subflavum]